MRSLSPFPFNHDTNVGAVEFSHLLVEYYVSVLGPEEYFRDVPHLKALRRLMLNTKPRIGVTDIPHIRVLR